MPCIPRIDFRAHANPFPFRIFRRFEVAGPRRRLAPCLGNHPAFAARSAVIATACMPAKPKRAAASSARVWLVASMTVRGETSSTPPIPCEAG